MATIGDWSSGSRGVSAGTNHGEGFDAVRNAICDVVGAERFQGFHHGNETAVAISKFIDTKIAAALARDGRGDKRCDVCNEIATAFITAYGKTHRLCAHCWAVSKWAAPPTCCVCGLVLVADERGGDRCVRCGEKPPADAEDALARDLYLAANPTGSWHMTAAGGACQNSWRNVAALVRAKCEAARAKGRHTGIEDAARECDRFKSDYVIGTTIALHVRALAEKAK